MTIQPATQHPRKIEGSDMYSVDVVVQYTNDNIGIGYYDFEEDAWIAQDHGERVHITSWHYPLFVCP